jgi:hypothetical protein
MLTKNWACPGSPWRAHRPASWRSIRSDSCLSVPITWHHFDPKTFDIGRDQIELGPGRSIGLYSAPRSIIDSFRMRHREGGEMALTALKNWLRSGGQPSELLKMARDFPRASPALSRTLEILL